MNLLRKNTNIFLLVILFTFIFSFISVSKHNHFQSFAWDLAFFDELIWKVSQGIEPRSSFNDLHILGDHFQPVLLLFVPLYWIKSDVNTLLISHAVIASLSVLPIYLLAKKILTHEFLALVISFGFLLFTPYQHAVFDGFHQSVFAPFFIGWTYYFLETKKVRLFWLSILGLIITKEEYALLACAIGLVTILFYKQIRMGIKTIVIGIISLFLLIYVAIPYFQKGPYTHFGYGELGGTPHEVIINSLTKPSILIKLLAASEKIHTVFSSLLSFGFLPLLTPIHLVPILQQYLVRFIDTVTVHRALNLNHYSFPLAPLFSIATIYSLKQLQGAQISKKVICFYLLSFTVLQNVFFHGPINSLFKKQFYETHLWENDAHALVSQIPTQATIASQNSLLPHFSQRKKFYLLPEIGNAEYVAVDLVDGPNKYSPLDHTRTQELVEKLLTDKTFKLIWQRGESRLLKRTN